MQAAAQVSELEVPLQCRVAWLRKNYSYFEDEHRDVLMDKLDALTKTSGKKVHCRLEQQTHESQGVAQSNNCCSNPCQAFWQECLSC